MLDQSSVAGKALPVEGEVGLLVVGAGPAGVAAALEAAGRGVEVTLVDEHPLDPGLFGLDVPLQFGGCAGPAVQNRDRMLERVAVATPGLEEAFDAGVDVRLGVACWGLFAHGPATRWLPPLAAGLADGGRAWQVACRSVIVAAGRRDAGLAFPGWDLPGVAGAAAVRLLLNRYDAFLGRRLVILGSDADALELAGLALARGLEVAAVVEVGPEPTGPAERVAALQAAGVPFLTRTVIAGAVGRADRVETVRLAGPDGDRRELACDTVVLATGPVPATELLAALGCALHYRGELGGWVPVLDAAGRTSVPGVSAAGDCAGVWPAKCLDPGIARDEGRRAALGDGASRPVAAGRDVAAGRAAWLEASLAVSGPDVPVCLCEEVTCREVAEVRAPRYLGADPARVGGPGTLGRLAGNGCPEPDQVKRLTRAGMGYCQGRRCREGIAALLARESGLSLGEVPLASYRAPVRPLPLGLLADTAEPAAVAEGWDIWMGIPTMWTPPWRLGPDGLPAPEDAPP